MTDELLTALDAATSLAAVENLYRPYKQKRRIREPAAREKGLDTLADIIFAQDIRSGDVSALAEPFANAEKGVPDQVAEAAA